MIQGLYAAASGLVATETSQEVIANNLANASTAGFKRQNPVHEGFYSVFAKELRHPLYFNMAGGPAGGARVAETYSNLDEGVVTKTGDPLNIALEGPGYLVVDTPGGERYTRAGTLAVNSQGYLSTVTGHTVQGLDGGPISARGGGLSIDEEGTVRTGGVVAGRLRVVEFEDPHMLTREGYTLYRASDQALDRSARAADTRVLHKHLEMSNVQLPKEMINLTLGLRTYAANQRVITTISDTMGRLIDQVGSPL